MKNRCIYLCGLFLIGGIMFPPLLKNSYGQVFKDVLTYKADKALVKSLPFYAVSGIIWGAREAYHADNRIFEKKFGADELSFWGSKAWLRNYYGNNVNNGHRPEWLNSTRDFWHFSGLTFKVTFFFSISKTYSSDKKPVHKVIDTIIGASASSMFSFVTYEILRNE